jgi:hypothetical protein
MEGIQLLAALALLLRADLAGTRERGFEHDRDVLLATDFAADVADQPAEPGAQDAQLPTVAVELFGVGVALKHELAQLAGAIDWDWIDGEIAPLYSEKGGGTDRPISWSRASSAVSLVPPLHQPERENHNFRFEGILNRKVPSAANPKTLQSRTRPCAEKTNLDQRPSRCSRTAK